MAMSIVVEDGTGMPDAASYVSLEEATEYFAWLGNEEWDAEDEKVLVRASQAVDLVYAPRYKGTKLTAEQGLMFPRTPFTDADGFERTGIPTELKKAVFEAAYMLQNGEEIVVNPSREGLVTKSTKKVGSLEITKEYADTQTSTSKNVKLDKILSTLLKNSSSGLRNVKLVLG